MGTFGFVARLDRSLGGLYQLQRVSEMNSEVDSEVDSELMLANRYEDLSM